MPRAVIDVLVSWKRSLNALGTCGHLGPLPVSAITRMAIWPHKGNNIGMMFVFDPMISIVNQRFCGNKYRYWTAQLFGDDPQVKEDNMGFPIDFQLPKIEGLQSLSTNQIKRGMALVQQVLDHAV